MSWRRLRLLGLRVALPYGPPTCHPCHVTRSVAGPVRSFGEARQVAQLGATLGTGVLL